MNRHRFAVVAGFVAAAAISFIPVADGGRLAAAVGEPHGSVDELTGASAWAVSVVGSGEPTPQQEGEWLPASDLVGLNGIEILVEMRYRDVPLGTVFMELGRRAGFRVQFVGDGFHERTSVAFARLPVRGILEVLAQDAGITYQVADAATLLIRMDPEERLPSTVVRRIPQESVVPIPEESIERVSPVTIQPTRAEGIVAPAGPPYRVGGEIREPTKIYHVDPQYPELARRARLDGFVILQATIDRQGYVTDAEVLRGLGLGLDVAARDAVVQWRYTPTYFRGEPVEVILTVNVVFQLIQ